MLKKLLSILLIGCSVVLSAQEGNLSNLRTQIVEIQGDSILLDSLTIIPESFEIIDLGKNQTLDTSFYEIKNSTIIFRKKEELSGPFQIKYRTLPYALDQTFNHLDTTLIKRKSDGTYIGIDYTPFEPQRGLLDYKGLDYNGSFARGISFGNNFCFSINSSSTGF